MKKLPEDDPVYKFINLDTLAKTHQEKLSKGQKLELPSRHGEKTVIDKYNVQDGTVLIDVLEKDDDKLAKTSYKLERKYVGIESHFSGFREMLTISHTLVDNKSNLLTTKNTRMDFSRGNIIEDNINQMNNVDNKEFFQEEASYLRGYFLDLEGKEKTKNKEKRASVFSSFFRKDKDVTPELDYRGKFELITDVARKHIHRLEIGEAVEFKLSPDTTVIIDEYKPDLKITELKVLEQRAGKVSRIDFKMEKNFSGMESGFGDSCFSKALLTVNHTLLNSIDKTVSMREAQIDCLGGHVKEIDEKKINRNEDLKGYMEHADSIRDYQVSLTSAKKQKKKENFLMKIFHYEDRALIEEHKNKFLKIKEMLKKESFDNREFIDLSCESKLFLDKSGEEDKEKSFYVIEKDEKGLRKIEYELKHQYTGDNSPNQSGFSRILTVNVTLLDIKNQVITFSEFMIDLDFLILLDSHSELIKKKENEMSYEKYESSLLNYMGFFTDKAPEKKQSFLSFLNGFKKGRL